MNFTMPLFYVATPEIFLLCMASVILLVDIFLPKRHSGITYLLIQGSLIITFLLVLIQYRHFSGQTITFSGHYILDKLAILTKLFVLVAGFFSFIYTRHYIKHRSIARGEYFILGLFAIFGMMIMSSAYSFLTIYLGLELLSLSLYAMVALYKDSQIATEAAMKYFVMGALASGLLLYGMSMIYGVTGTIQISLIGNLSGHASQNHVVILFGLVFMLAGLLFKFGAVPFHMWVPDVYDGAPTSATLFIASAPKIAAFCITMRILVEGLSAASFNWQLVLIVVSILSMFGGK